MNKLERAIRKALFDLTYYQSQSLKTRGTMDGFFIDTCEDLSKAIDALESSRKPDSRIQIGTKWKTRGKHPRDCEVIDILQTYNLAGECVQIEYISQHDFIGQMVKHKDLSITILKGMGAL